MNKQEKATPFNSGFGDSIGRGKDSVVVPLKDNNKQVVKWNHTPKDQTSPEEHFNRLLYKKKKYEMLTFFLGDFIPKSDFVLGNKVDGTKLRTKEYTVQKRVPQRTIASLSDEQKFDPRLIYNLHLLIMKLKAMYRIVHQVNDSIGEKGRLDTMLDLGGLSKMAEKIEEDKIDISSIDKNFMASPNLLVDPETMQLYCIDFGQGEWSDEKEATLDLVKAIGTSNNELLELISRAQH